MDEHICSFKPDSKAPIEKCLVCGHHWERDRDGTGWTQQNRADRRWRTRVWRAHYRRQARESDKQQHKYGYIQH